MPTPPIPPTGLPPYNAYFQADIGIAWFNVERNGYSSTVEGNKTVEPVPWASSYSVVIQRGGLMPLTRSYRALVYTEADFIALAVLVNRPSGEVATPRETAVAANLDSIRRGQSLDYTTPAGITEVELSLTILQ